MAWNGRYQLATQIGPHGFFAEVEVEVESAEFPTDPPVKVMFSELRTLTHGVDWRSATTFGILYAVSKLAGNLVGKGLIVRVTDVRGMTGDTGYMDLAFAAAFAVWKAFDHSPENPPTLDTTAKSFLFPK
jgi:hypothetical protein